VHNPGFGPLNWKFTAASLALINSVSWIDDVSPQSSRVDPLDGDVACGGYSCAGEVVTIRVMQDDWMRSQSNDGTALKTVEHAITPQVHLLVGANKQTIYSQTNRQIDKQTNKQTDNQTNKQTNKQTI
jgi:hypothetical protein